MFRKKKTRPPDDEFARLVQSFATANEHGNVDEAEAAAYRCMAYVSQHAGEDNSPWLQAVGVAHEREMARDTPGAEAAYQMALCAATAEGTPWMAYKAHHDLSAFYSRLGRDAEALAEARLALEAARHTDMSVLLCDALDSLSAELRRAGDTAGALAAVNESIAAMPDERMFDKQRARALVSRASCHLAAGDVAAARTDLEAAWPVLEPFAGVVLLAGNQSALAGWWEVSARIRDKEGDLQGAADAFGNAVEFRRNVAAAPQLEGVGKYSGLARVLTRYAEALRAAGHPDEAGLADSESQSILTAIGKDAGSAG